jgi:hypothetical protein
MHWQFGTYQTEFLSPFTTWSYQGAQESPWATAITDTASPIDGDFRMILTHDPAQ